jgi:hypothetical protein
VIQCTDESDAALGCPYNGAITHGLDVITADNLGLVMSNGIRKTWTRAPAE